MTKPAVALLAALALSQAGTSAQPGTPAARDERFTPVVQSVPSPPRWFPGTDGLVHLVYELRLTNGLPVPVTVTGVEVLEAGGGRSLATLRAGALTAATSLLASGGQPTTTLPASSLGVVWLDVALADRNRLPVAVEHRVTVSVPPGLPVPASVVATGGRAEVDRRPPVVLSPPLRGGGWAALGSCCDGPHRRSVQPAGGELHLSQRFAIDFNKLDAQNRLAAGDLGQNASYPSFGQTVLAVADATVFAAADRFPDQVPGDPRAVTLQSANGNHVILDLREGRYAFYAHLKAGSVLVKSGGRVRRGQPIGELGNSGSSTGPHLHFHVMDRPRRCSRTGCPTSSTASSSPAAPRRSPR